MEPIVYIACWTFTAVAMSWNVRMVWRPLPRSFWEIRDLRREAQRIVKESPLKIPFDKEAEAKIIARRRSVEYLRLYVKFGRRYRLNEIHVLISHIRMARMKCQTNLTPSRLTAEHLFAFHEFYFISQIMDYTTAEDIRKNRAGVERSCIYALNHLDRANDMLSIMRDRSIYDFKQVKSLMTDMNEVNAGVLQEGML